MSADVELNNVSVTFGSFYAAKSVNVKINGGEFFSFLGPSGCGKTTLLRAISGFQDPSEGSVLIDNKDMFGIGPNKRPTSLIFQNLALFPLMSVSENIAFSLEVRGVSKKDRQKIFASWVNHKNIKVPFQDTFSDIMIEKVFGNHATKQGVPGSYVSYFQRKIMTSFAKEKSNQNPFLLSLIHI